MNASVPRTAIFPSRPLLSTRHTFLALCAPLPACSFACLGSQSQSHSLLALLALLSTLSLNFVLTPAPISPSSPGDLSALMLHSRAHSWPQSTHTTSVRGVPLLLAARSSAAAGSNRGKLMSPAAAQCRLQAGSSLVQGRAGRPYRPVSPICCSTSSPCTTLPTTTCF